MQIYFVRHANASRKTTWRKDDSLRPLTRTGRQRFGIAAASLVQSGSMNPELIVTSPLVRARQTAEILAKALGGRVPLVEDARLGPTFDRASLDALLSEHRGVRSIAIVGHNPSFAAVLSEVVGGADIDVRKGAVALVDLESLAPASGRLLWIAPPNVFPGCP